ncbi:MAG: isoprenylcysteine carboxylmethyltransferase family protein [Anaerolineaceae bacterium]|nr:isoprenylcysteine carboxylmethyltransferase family protein [Anaerolineaceae bacterium]
MRIRIRKEFMGTLLVGVSLFLGAGRLNWVMAWVYMGLNFLGVFANAYVLMRYNPEVLAARAKTTQEDTKRWDKVFTSLYGPLLLITMAIIGLDAVRFGWSQVPFWIQMISMVLFVFGWGFSLWALAVNKHFETSVRIQGDRGHTTITTGPYKIVRHPGYAGMTLLYAVSPLCLGSYWGLIPAGLLIIAFVVRTALEDQTLQEELSDYPAFVKKVRYRLLPGIW